MRQLSHQIKTQCIFTVTKVNFKSNFYDNNNNKYRTDYLVGSGLYTENKVSENLLGELMVYTQNFAKYDTGVASSLGVQLAKEELLYFLPSAPVNSCSMWIVSGGVEVPHGGVLPDSHLG